MGSFGFVVRNIGNHISWHISDSKSQVAERCRIQLGAKTHVAHDCHSLKRLMEAIKKTKKNPWILQHTMAYSGWGFNNIYVEGEFKSSLPRVVLYGACRWKCSSPTLHWVRLGWKLCPASSRCPAKVIHDEDGCGTDRRSGVGRLWMWMSTKITTHP